MESKLRNMLELHIQNCNDLLSKLPKAQKTAALIIGLNYKREPTVSSLNGCIQDAHNVQNFLIENMQFSKDSVECHTDDKENLSAVNLSQIIANFVKRAQFCDRVWIHFSGHGHYVEDHCGDEKDGYDECLVAGDGDLITDDFLLNDMILKFSKSTQLVCVMDCCHSGSQLDLKYRYIGGRRSVFMNEFFNEDSCRVLCWSGCKDEGTSADAVIDQKWSGAMTTMLLRELENGDFNCRKILLGVRKRLRDEGFQQLPQLTSSFRVDPDTTIWQ